MAAVKRTTTTKTYVVKANRQKTELVTKREASTLSHMNVNVPTGLLCTSTSVPSVYIQSSACCKT